MIKRAETCPPLAQEWGALKKYSNLANKLVNEDDNEAIQEIHLAP
jgi:hypothetical protein